METVQQGYLLPKGRDGYKFYISHYLIRLRYPGMTWIILGDLPYVSSSRVTLVGRVARSVVQMEVGVAVVASFHRDN